MGNWICNLDLISLNRLLSMGGTASLQTSQGSIFDPFASGNFITVKTPELFSLYNLYCKSLHEAKKEPL